MTALTNHAGFGLAMAVWLAHDEYENGQEEHPDANVVSATALLKSTRRFILESRLPLIEQVQDIRELIASRLGTAIHDSVEHAWLKGYRRSMLRLGYPKKMVDKIRINPEEVEDGTIPVYLEQRFFRELEVDGYQFLISGKFDQIIDGEVNDTKTTSVYTYIKNTSEEKYRLQGSIYRWINPDKVTSDIMRIQHVFTDWQRSMTKTQGYPQDRVKEFTVDLMSPEDTEKWMRNKLHEILHYQDMPESKLPRCSDEDLWKEAPQYKYYTDPAKALAGGKSSKNFEDLAAANRWWKHDKQGKGTVITVPGKVKACGYCPAFSLCSQKDEYEHA